MFNSLFLFRSRVLKNCQLSAELVPHSPYFVYGNNSSDIDRCRCRNRNVNWRGSRIAAWLSFLFGWQRTFGILVISLTSPSSPWPPILLCRDAREFLGKNTILGSVFRLLEM